MSETPPTPDPVTTPDPVPMNAPYPRDMGGAPTQEEKTHAALCWFLSIIIPIIVPLIFFLISNEKPFTKRHAAIALGVHIAVLIGYIISGFLMVILIGFLTYLATFIFMLVVCIMGGMAANKGETYDPPLLGKTIANLFKV